MLIDNYNAVRARIDAACERVGRDKSEVKLIAVSKTKPAEMIRELYEAGVRDFGENKVQELCEKADLLHEVCPEIRFHQIGTLQRNKVKYLMRPEVTAIHSVDSLKLAQEIEKEAGKKGVETVPVLLEINIGGEESKGGCRPDEAVGLAQAFCELKHLSLIGLMCVAPATDNPETVRPYFRRMRELRAEVQAFQPYCRELSMGMSGDFETAVEEGATLVRVGSSIFGERDYGKI